MSFKGIIKLMEIRTLGAGALPVLLGSIYSWYEFGEIDLLYLILLTVAMMLIQSATNMINDYFDFKSGADSKEKADEKPLVSGEIAPKQVLFIILIYQFIACAIGIFIASKTSYNILFVVIIGGVISILYAFGPLPISYTPIGEVVSGITMGIGITTTVIFIQSGIVNLRTLLVAVPTSIFIGTILLSNNLSDAKLDKKVGRKTLPILIGVKNAEKLWVLNVILLIGSTFVLLMIGIYPITVFIIVLLLFPYKSISDFLSYDKSINTKGRTMALINKVGMKYHFSALLGLLISIMLRGGV